MGSRMSVCPRCGAQLSYIEQYSQWYCYNCKEYQQPQVAPQASPRPYAPIGRGDERMDGHPPQMPQAKNQIIKRPMTDMERELVAKSYRSGKKILRRITFTILLLLFLFLMFITFLLSSDWVDPALSTVLTIVAVIVTIAISAPLIVTPVSVLQFRKKMSDALKDGTAIEVHGSALRTTAYISPFATYKGQYFTVGPISLYETKEVLGMIQEGAQVSVLCIPKLKMAMSINNIGLKNPVPMKCPPNIEESAVFKAAAPPDHPGQQLPPTPSYQSPQQQPPLQQYQQQEQRTHQMEKQDRFCPFCGAHNPIDYNFCTKCKNKLPEVKS